MLNAGRMALRDFDREGTTVPVKLERNQIDRIVGGPPHVR